MQIFKEVRHNRVISFLQYMQGITNCRVPVSVLSWQSKKIKRVVRSSLAAETCSMSTCQETSRLDAHNVGTDDPELRTAFSRRVPAFLSPTAKVCTTQYTKKEQLQRQQTRDWQLSWAIVKAKAVSGETDLRWINARCQVADCLTKHASRKSEAVLQKILQEKQWRITAEEDMLDKRKQEREIRNSALSDEELWLTSE